MDEFAREPITPHNRLKAANFMSDVNHLIRDRLPLVEQVYKMFSRLSNQVDDSHPLDVKSQYQTLIDHTKTVEKVESDLREKISQLQSKLTQFQEGTKEYNLYSSVVRACEDSYNTINRILIDMHEVLEIFYEDHQGILVS